MDSRVCQRELENKIARFLFLIFLRDCVNEVGQRDSFRKDVFSWLRIVKVIKELGDRIAILDMRVARIIMLDNAKHESW